MTDFNYSNVTETEHELFNDLNWVYPGWLSCTIIELKEAQSSYAKLAATHHKHTYAAKLSLSEVTEYIKIRCKLEGV